MPNRSDAPWSGAFISFIMAQVKRETAGLSAPLRNFDFPYNASHTAYAQAIRTNPSKYPFQVLNPNELTTAQTALSNITFGLLSATSKDLKRGDIIVKNRSGNTLFFDSPVWSGNSHGDIVVKDRTGDGGFVIGGNLIGGNLKNRVGSDEVKNLTDYFVIIRPNNSRHADLIARAAERELQRWKDNRWTNAYQDGARQRVNEYRRLVKLPEVSELEAEAILNPSVSPQAQNAISPFIKSLESFHPNIQYELTRRRIATEAINVHMPFVKLTSLSEVLKDNLETTETLAYCPSIGVHSRDETSFDNIYSTRSDKSVIGYAYTKEGTEVPVLVLDPTKDAKNIPIPGITQVNAERSTAGPMGVRGGLLKANLKIVAYSVGQVDALLRYFLRPATRVVLEFGRMSSNQTHPNERFTPFDWKEAVKGNLIIGETKVNIENYFTTLITSPKEQKEFIKQYVYNNHGNYELFIAYVVKFNLKYNKNNTFEIELTLHSVQQVEVPTKHTGVQSTCPSPTNACDAMDIQEYFSDTYSWKNNSFGSLMAYYQGKEVDGIAAATKDIEFGKDNIIPLKGVGSTNSTQAGTRENEYLVSWRFFVEKILNDKRYGIASMLGNGASTDMIAELALLRPVLEPDTNTSVKGLIANQCGYHPNLRSVNPGIMVIYNPIAQSRYENTEDRLRYESIIDVAKRQSTEEDKRSRVPQLLSTGSIEEAMKSKPGFENLLTDEKTKAGASLLSRGVWLNTKAIKEAFTATDTITSAISSLLNMMNSATEGYWNLQLYSTDTESPGLYVIDMGLSKEPKTMSTIDKENFKGASILDSTTGITPRRYQGETEDTPQYIYMFNRGTKLFNDGELGSDLIDLNVEFNLPQVIAVQAIANIGGPAQKPLLSSIDVEELRSISLIKNLYTPCNNSDVNLSCESDEIRDLQKAVTDAERALTLAEQRAAPARAALARVEGFDNEALAQQRVNNLVKEPTQNLTKARNALTDARVNEFNPNLVGTIREYASLGTALEFIEINPSRMMKELNIDSVSGTPIPRSGVHAFNSSNLTKTVVDITLPGIGGIELFQSFLVDRIPSIITRGFYVVTKVVHDFSTQNGWITKIQGRFRFRPEGEEDAPVITTPSGAVVTQGANPATDPMARRTLNSTVSTFRRAPVTPQLNITPERPEFLGPARNPGRRN